MLIQIQTYKIYIYKPSAHAQAHVYCIFIDSHDEKR
jgi:hypothetical protein